jgi:hypothetical protein
MHSEKTSAGERINGRQVVLSSFYSLFVIAPIPVAAPSKGSVCGRLLAGVAGFNPTGAIDVCLLRVLFVVS